MGSFYPGQRVRMKGAPDVHGNIKGYRDGYYEVEWDNDIGLSPHGWRESIEAAPTDWANVKMTVNVDPLFAPAALNPSPRERLLDEAKSTITKDRNNQYGPPTQDFARTAELLTAMGFRFVDDEDLIHDIQSHHIALMMILLKMSRLAWSSEKYDSWLDVAGYAACGWECVVEEKE